VVDVGAVEVLGDAAAGDRLPCAARVVDGGDGSAKRRKCCRPVAEDGAGGRRLAQPQQAGVGALGGVKQVGAAGSSGIVRLGGIRACSMLAEWPHASQNAIRSNCSGGKASAVLTDSRIVGGS
jgi:hypothetical protein